MWRVEREPGLAPVVGAVRALALRCDECQRMKPTGEVELEPALPRDRRRFVVHVCRACRARRRGRWFRVVRSMVRLQAFIRSGCEGKNWLLRKCVGRMLEWDRTVELWRECESRAGS